MKRPTPDAAGQSLPGPAQAASVRGVTPMPASPEHLPERAAVRAGRIGLVGVAFPRGRPCRV
ncbi:MAG: hypothetical protein WAV90_12860, partial [Gordonia amarae]